jgi:hypothetical protein
VDFLSVLFGVSIIEELKTEFADKLDGKGIEVSSATPTRPTQRRKA